MFLDNFCAHFARNKTIGSSVLVNCYSIGATFWGDILLVYSTLGPEDTWLEAAHAWVFVVKLGGLRLNSIVFVNLSLMMFPSDTLKASNNSTNMEFMC